METISSTQDPTFMAKLRAEAEDWKSKCEKLSDTVARLERDISGLRRSLTQEEAANETLKEVLELLIEKLKQ
jgi:predicted RNase H-like nuclease (RuvC/YqgF family)